MKKYLFLGVFFSSFLYAGMPAADVRFSVGPAWHEFYSFEALTPHDKIISQHEMIRTDFNLMPYVAGTVRAYFAEVFLRVFAGSGFMQHGRAMIGDFIIQDPDSALEFVRECSMRLTVPTVDVELGYCFNVGHGMELRPLAGYLFNQEKIALCALGAQDKICLKNRWQGGYIGGELVGHPAARFELSILFKAFFGKVKSIFSSRVAEASQKILQTIDAPNALWTAHAFGAVFEFNATYAVREHLTVGSTILFSQYRNHNNGCVIPLSCAPSKAYLQRIFFEQLSWLLFASYCF